MASINFQPPSQNISRNWNWLWVDYKKDISRIRIWADNISVRNKGLTAEEQIIFKGTRTIQGTLCLEWNWFCVSFWIFRWDRLLNRKHFKLSDFLIKPRLKKNECTLKDFCLIPLSLVNWTPVYRRTIFLFILIIIIFSSSVTSHF